jgi:zinc transport system substrate-binding protein
MCFYKVLFFFLVSLLPHQQRSMHAEELSVLVSVAPYIHIVERIGGDSIQVKLIVPQGADSHNYEPTPKQIQEASKAKIWFYVGEPFEKRAQQALKNQNKEFILCDLRQNLNLHHEQHCEHSCGYDPHIWMSPKMMIIQVHTIAEGLKLILPDKSDAIDTNAQKLIDDLMLLDQELRQQLDRKAHITILVAHPAYGYFCREYGITQMTIEQEGKDPTVKAVTQLINDVKKLDIKKIFIQSRYGHKGAYLIAKEIGAKVVVLDPYNPNYFAMMRECGQQFSESQ